MNNNNIMNNYMNYNNNIKKKIYQDKNNIYNYNDNYNYYDNDNDIGESKSVVIKNYNIYEK